MMHEIEPRDLEISISTHDGNKCIIIHKPTGKKVEFLTDDYFKVGKKEALILLSKKIYDSSDL